MQQSSAIFANLLIAYLLFITLRGELPIYLTLLRGGGKQETTPTTGGGGAGGAGDGISSFLDSIPGLNDFGVNLGDFGSGSPLQSYMESSKPYRNADGTFSPDGAMRYLYPNDY